MINLDSEDPAGLASFYSAVLGWNVLHSEGDYAMIGDGSINIGFGKVPGYTAPGWPEESGLKRYHRIYVDDLDSRECFDPASKPAEQPSPDRWRVPLIRAVIPSTFPEELTSPHQAPSRSSTRAPTGHPTSTRSDHATGSSGRSAAVADEVDVPVTTIGVPR